MFFRTPHHQDAFTLFYSATLQQLKILSVKVFTFRFAFFDGGFDLGFFIFGLLWLFSFLLLFRNWNWNDNLFYENVCDHEVTVLVTNALLDWTIVFFGFLWHFFLLSLWRNDLTNWCGLTYFLALFFWVVVRVIGPVLAGRLLFGYDFLVLSFSHFWFN